MKAKKAKKILSLLLALVLCLSLFAACGDNNGSSSEGNPSSGTVSAEDSGNEEDSGAETDDTTYAFPLDEPVTFTAWNTTPSTSLLFSKHILTASVRSLSAS